MLSALSRARHSVALPTSLVRGSRHASFRGPQKITRQATPPPPKTGTHVNSYAGHSSSSLNALHGRDLPTVVTAAERWSLSPNNAVRLLLMLNGLVAFNHASAISEEQTDSVAIHWVTSRGHVDGGLYHTLATSMFSHVKLTHLVTDMLGIYVFGRGVAPVLGTKRFLSFFAMSGIMASWVEIQRQRRTGQRNVYFGARGPVNALAILNVCLVPQRTLLFFKLIPVHPWVALTLWLASDVIGLREDTVNQKNDLVEM